MLNEFEENRGYKEGIFKIFYENHNRKVVKYNFRGIVVKFGFDKMKWWDSLSNKLYGDAATVFLS